MKHYNYHYVYRITNLVTGYHYYGTKSCDEHPVENIGKKYYSSSTNKFFIQDQKNNPQDYKYKVIKIFETSRKNAIDLEVKLHSKFDVKHHPKFINKSNQTSEKFDTTGTNIGRKINKTRINRIDSAGLNVNQLNGFKVSEKWNDLEWKELTIKAMKETKNDIIWKNTIGKEAIKKMLEKRSDPSHNSFYGKTIDKVKSTKSRTIINGKTINQIAGEKCSKTKSSLEWKQIKGKYAIEQMLNTRLKNGISYQKENNPNAKTIIIYDRFGDIQHTLVGQFRSFCSEMNIPYYPFVESIKKNGLPIYRNKVSFSKAKKKGWDIYAGWYALEKK